MDLTDPSALDDLIGKFFDFLASDALRNILTSGKVLAELARAIYRLVLEGMAATTQLIETAHIFSSTQVFPAQISTSQTIEADFIGPTSKVFPMGVTQA